MRNSTIIRSGFAHSRFIGLALCFFGALLSPLTSSAAILALDPSAGSFVVGSTIEVPVWVNTEGQPINAIAVDIKFPPDKLQLVSPSTGHSIITLWTAPPSFNNQSGTVSFQGVIPNGITTSRGLVTTLSFRVKAPGKAYVQFAETTKVLKHDGLGTSVLNGINGGVYTLLLPPPAGPIVASPTHPDPSITYPSNNIILSWVPEDSSVTEYSYIFTDSPLDIPDDISEGSKNSLIYRDIPDGRHYFHVKSYQKGAWGGTTHFSMSVDATAPAEFPLLVIPKPPLEQNKESILEFQTTDAYSGIDYYEVKVVPLQGDQSGILSPDQTLFVEATSPYVLPAFHNTGRYDVIVHAFDRAGNMRESKITLTVMRPLIHATTTYVEFFGTIIIPWWLLILLLLVLVLLLVVFARTVRKRHRDAHERLETKSLPESVSTVASDLEQKRKEYLRITQLALIPMLFLASFVHPAPALADDVRLEPPMVSTISRNINNDEIFYAGGITGLPDATITLYIENTKTGETFTKVATVDRRGEWFYRHDGFLPAGDYALWAQESLGGTMSPPSSQEKFTVNRAAFQIGFSRISYAALYALIALLLLCVIIGLIAYIIYHHRAAKKKFLHWVSEVKEAEQSVARGFAVLKRDIEAELDVIRKIKLTGKLRKEEVGREEQLKKDLEWVESSINNKLSDLEQDR